MNRLNPLYILLLSVIFALFAAYSAVNKQKQLEEIQSEYHAKEDLALKLKALKNAYSPKRKREILRLLRSASLRKSGIKYNEKRDRLSINGKNVDIKAANMLLSKLLNGTYNLEKLSLNREKEGVDLAVEVVWR